MIKKILPDSVTVTSSQDLHSDRPCYDEELALISKAVPKRRDEFITARYCARQALAQRSIYDTPILKGDNRQPLWPNGIVGSITHCKNYCAVALAESHQFHAIGIDSEPNAPLKKNIYHLIITDNELNHMEQNGLPEGLCSKLIFSAKESVFKCYFPLTLQYLDFLEAEISFPAEGQFKVNLLVPPPDKFPQFQGLRGNYLITDDHIHTALTLPV